MPPQAKMLATIQRRTAGISPKRTGDADSGVLALGYYLDVAWLAGCSRKPTTWKRGIESESDSPPQHS